jgi:hypothetical protein
VNDDGVSALEVAVADLGSLLVQMDKFRAAGSDEARALRAACLGIGDRARRAHRHGRLDPALARELDADATLARASLERWLAGVRASTPYVEAVAALGRGDDARLRVALAQVFAGATAIDPPAVLHHPVVWQRRGRPRAADDVAAEVALLRDDGLPSEGDPATPGVDPALPGVGLQTVPPPGAPIYVVLRGAARPAWVLSLDATGDVIVPGARLRVPFAVGLADPDDDDLDGWTLDPPAYRDALATALRARGLPLDEQ